MIVTSLRTANSVLSLFPRTDATAISQEASTHSRARCRPPSSDPPGGSKAAMSQCNGKKDSEPKGKAILSKATKPKGIVRPSRNLQLPRSVDALKCPLSTALSRSTLDQKAYASDGASLSGRVDGVYLSKHNSVMRRSQTTFSSPLLLNLMCSIGGSTPSTKEKDLPLLNA
jgi:hypothetical protein